MDLLYCPNCSTETTCNGQDFSEHPCRHCGYSAPPDHYDDYRTLYQQSQQREAELVEALAALVYWDFPGRLDRGIGTNTDEGKRWLKARELLARYRK